jgi:MFS family permease
MMSLPNPPAGPLAVLRYRDYRLLWIGQVFSQIGSRMQGAALPWQLYLITHSKVALGGMGLARLVPLLAFALLGGVLADAFDRRRVMLVSQSLLALLAGAIGLWSAVGFHTAWPIYLTAGLNVAIMMFDAPARQSMIATLVPRERLADAVSLNSISMQTASIVGPALAGLVIVRYGVHAVYWVNAASFLTVIGALLLMGPMARTTAEERPRVSLRAAVEGLRFVRDSRLLLSLMLLDFLANFFSSATALLPVYANDIVKGGALAYGWLSAAPAVGSLLAAAAITLLPPIRRQGSTVLWAVFFYGVATVFFGLSRTFLVCFLALAATGLADTVSTVLRQTIRQLVTPNALRGRMTSINMLFVQGGPQLGDLEAGLVAGWLGAPFSVVSGGIGSILMVAWMAARAPWLRNYERDTEDREE